MHARTESVVSCLTPKQVREVIEAVPGPRERALLAIVYQFGLRRGEVKYLRRRDYIPENSLNGTLTVWRLKSRRRNKQTERMLVPDEKPVWARTRRVLEEYLATREDDHEALFLGCRSRPLGPQAVYYAFRDAAVKAGIPEGLRHPHVLRHSILTHMANMGLSLLDIAGWADHNSLTATLRYAKVLTPRKEDMVLRSEASHCFARF